MDAIFSFLVGCIATIFLFTGVDQKFEDLEYRYTAAIELCKALGSEPESFDVSEITCKNGTVVSY